MGLSYYGAQIVNFRPSGDQEWAQKAACAPDDGLDLMFPHEHDVQGIEAAKKICARCPVREQCLSGALDRGETFGIWGGTTAAERRSMKRQTTRKAAKAAREAARPKVMTARVSADGKQLVGVPVTDLDTNGLT